jgi:PPOX class probable F420-dependent enzyme
MSMDDTALHEFLARPWVAKLGTLNPDGSMHISPMWYHYDGSTFTMSANRLSIKAKNLRRDSNATLLVDSREFPYRGVIMYGRGSIEEGDREARLKIFTRYLPPDEAVAYVDYWVKKAGERVIIRFTPSRFVTWDHSKRSNQS